MNECLSERMDSKCGCYLTRHIQVLNYSHTKSVPSHQPQCQNLGSPRAAHVCPGNGLGGGVLSTWREGGEAPAPRRGAVGRGVTRPAMCTGMAAGWLGGKRDNEKGWEGEHGGPPVTGGQFAGPTGLSSAAPGFADAEAELDGNSSQGGFLCPEKAHSLHSSVPCPLTAPAPVPPSPLPAGGPRPLTPALTSGSH